MKRAWQNASSVARGRTLGSLTQALEVLNTILFLLSQDARQITGPSLDVDGSNGLEGSGFSPVVERTARRR
ncbi:MAG: hypothetical protein CL931_10465 [Deltaproteobacteria bacterium]|nr:hypothetical protein [Deltaproteobacteria bacterium]